MGELPGNYYETNTPALNLPRLTGDEAMVEVAIIGGGFAGLATARGLQERGERSLALLEAQKIGHGASGRNGGFVFGGYSRDAQALLGELGPETARELHAMTRDAVALIRQRIETHAIACDKVEGGALLLDWFHGTAALRKLRAQARLMREQFGVQLEELSPGQVRDAVETGRYGAGMLELGAFHFHPLKYAQGLAALLQADGARLFEHSPVAQIEALQGGGFRLITGEGASLSARQVIAAGGGYLRRLLPRLEGARLPIATYIVVTEPLPSSLAPIRTPAAIYDTRFAFDYYRMLADRRLLWGGRISIFEREPTRIAQLLRADMLRVFPALADVRIEHAWSGLMSYARHQMPQIGQLAPGLWFAQAFGGHGVAPTTVAGELLADAISGRRALPAAFERYGLTPVFGRLGLLAAQASYSWADIRDKLKDRLSR